MDTTAQLALMLCQLDRRMLAMEALLTEALAGYRMAGFPRPFRQGLDRGQRFYHLFTVGNNLALCGGLAAVRPDRLRPVELELVDCLACLSALTERTRPRG